MRKKSLSQMIENCLIWRKKATKKIQRETAVFG